MPNDKTASFLALARDLGITLVGIGNARHKFLDNESFPFHMDKQIFTHPSVRIDGWPAVWTLARQAGIHAGCGNSGQCQADTTGLELGVWILLASSEWARIQ